MLLQSVTMRYMSTGSMTHGILDFIRNFPGHHICKLIDVMRNVLKLIVSAVWAVILSFFYNSTAAKVNLPLKDLEKWFRYVKGVPPLYILAVAVYLIPNILSASFFLFPMFRRWIQNSDWHIVGLLRGGLRKNASIFLTLKIKTC